MDDQEWYDAQRRELTPALFDTIQRVIQDKGYDPAPTISAALAAVGQVASAHGLEDTFARMAAEDQCRDQGLDPSVLDQGPPDGQT